MNVTSTRKGASITANWNHSSGPKLLTPVPPSSGAACGAMSTVELSGVASAARALACVVHADGSDGDAGQDQHERETPDALGDC